MVRRGNILFMVFISVWMIGVCSGTDGRGATGGSKGVSIEVSDYELREGSRGGNLPG